MTQDPNQNIKTKKTPHFGNSNQGPGLTIGMNSNQASTSSSRLMDTCGRLQQWQSGPHLHATGTSSRSGDLMDLDHQKDLSLARSVLPDKGELSIARPGAAR